jgi:hypothetical protein
MGTGHAPAASRTPAAEKPNFCGSAKIAVALAATAMPFASTSCEEAERWLRILRVNGAVGNAMQALGLPEEPFEACPPFEEDGPTQAGSVDAVIAAAVDELHERRGEAITTEDLFVGVRNVYGPAFERVLAARGTTSSEVLELVERRAASTTGTRQFQ